MFKRKIETLASQAKRLKTCSETAALPDACKGSCSGWGSNFNTAPNGRLHRQVLRDFDNTIISIENRVISTDAWADTKHSGRSSTACAAEGTAGNSKRRNLYQPTAGGYVSKNGTHTNTILSEIGSLSAAQAAAGHYRQGFQGPSSNDLAAQQQPAATSASLEVQRAPSQESDITYDHQVMLGSCLLHPPMANKASSGQHSPDYQVNSSNSSSNGSRAQARDLSEEGFTETRTVNQPSMPISRSVVEPVNCASAMAPVGYLPTYQQYLLSHGATAGTEAAPAAAAAAADNSPTPGVPPHSAAVEPESFFNSTAATAVEAAPPSPVTAQPTSSSPLPVWGRRAARSKLVNITNTMTDPGRHQQQQQQQQRLVTPDYSATATISHRDMQHPKPTTRSASRRQLPSGSAVGAASMVKAGVQKRSTRSTRSVASRSKRHSHELHQAKADAAAYVWAPVDTAAAMCSKTAATAAAGTSFAVPTAAAAAPNRRKRSPKPPVTKASEIDQSASLASSAAEADGFEALMNQCDLENQADLEDVLYDGNDYDFFVAAEQPGLRVYDTTCVDEAAWAAWGAAGLAETAAEVAAEEIAAEEAAVAATIAATDHWSWEKVNDIYLLNDENPEVLVELDHQNGSNNATDDGPGVFSTGAAALAAFAASFPVR